MNVSKDSYTVTPMTREQAKACCGWMYAPPLRPHLRLASLGADGGPRHRAWRSGSAEAAIRFGAGWRRAAMWVRAAVSDGQRRAPRFRHAAGFMRPGTRSGLYPGDRGDGQNPLSRTGDRSGGTGLEFAGDTRLRQGRIRDHRYVRKTDA